MNTRRQLFEERLYQTWATYWDCDPALFSTPGTTLRQRANQGSSAGIHVWKIRHHAFVEHDPDHAAQLGTIIGAIGPSTPANSTQLVQGWNPQEIDTVTVGLVFHLFPPDLPESHLPGGFALRRLTEADKDQLHRLEECNSPEEVAEAYVATDHDMAFGVFQLLGQGEPPQLVVAASAYERAGFVDPGVLTHPAFRRRGFASAAVHALCEWANRLDRIMQYRCNQENTASLALARRLGFTQYITQESIWLR